MRVTSLRYEVSKGTEARRARQFAARPACSVGTRCEPAERPSLRSRLVDLSANNVCPISGMMSAFAPLTRNLNWYYIYIASKYLLWWHRFLFSVCKLRGYRKRDLNYTPDSMLNVKNSRHYKLTATLAVWKLNIVTMKYSFYIFACKRFANIIL